MPQKHFEDKAQLRFCHSRVTLRVKEFPKSWTGKAVTQLRQHSPVTVDLLTIVNLSAQRIVRPVISKRNDGLLNQLLGQKSDIIVPGPGAELVQQGLVLC